MTVRHLLKNAKTGRLSYRRIFPVELRSHVFGNPSEFKRSLGAKSITDLKAWAAYEAAHSEYETIAATARKKLEGRYDVLKPPMIAYLAAKFKCDWLIGDDEMRKSGDDSGLKKQKRGINWEIDDWREWEATGQLWAITDHWKQTALKLLPEQHIAIASDETEEFAALCYAINKAAIEAGRECLDRLQGQRTIEVPEAPQRPSKGLTEATVDPQATASDSTFESVVRAYMDNPRVRVTPATKESINTALRYFSEVHGTPLPEAISRRMVTDWLNLIALRPSRLPKDDKDLSLVELTSKYQRQLEVPRMSPATQKKYIGALAKCWAECQSAGDVPEGAPNPFRGHKMAPPVPSSSVNGMSLSEMQGIFDLPIFTAGERPKQGRGEACFWIPCPPSAFNRQAGRIK